MAAPVLKDLAAAPSVQTLFTSLTRQIDGYLAQPDPATLKSLTFMLTTLDKGFKAFDAKGSGPSSGMSMDSFLKGSGNGKPSMLESAGRQQVITVLPIKEAGQFRSGRQGHQGHPGRCWMRSSRNPNSRGSRPA